MNDITTIAEWNGSTPNDPYPDEWQRQRIRQINGSTIYLEQHDLKTGGTLRTPISSIHDALDIKWLSDDDIIALCIALEKPAKNSEPKT